MYNSNDTWKLINLKGNPVGDERYFEAAKVGGEVDFYSLMNSEGERCVYSPDGRRVIPAGVLIGDGEEPTLCGERIIDCFSSYDAICFITKNEEGNNVVNWYGIEE